MTVFRRVNNVPYDAVNIAHVSIPTKNPEDLIKINQADNRATHEVRRIMYSDLSGRLMDIDGESNVEVAYPVVTDMFYDKDQDKILDADEVIPEKAMPYYYRSKKLYYGPQIFYSGEFYQEYEVGFGTSLDSLQGTHVFVDRNRENFITPSFGEDSLLGFFLQVTGPVDSQYYKQKFKIIGNTGYEIEVEEELLVSQVGLDYTIIDESRSGNAKYSAPDSMNIRLIDRDGNDYRGSYIILIEPEYEQEVSVDRSSPEYSLNQHEGNSVYRVHVHLDRNDAGLRLSFVSGDMQIYESGWTPKDIKTDYTETVNPTEYFKYFPVATVIDPISESRKIVGSQTSRNGYYIFTTEKAKIDKRIIDQFSWRMKVVLNETTPSATIEKDELKVGILGDIPSSLSNFLSGDGSWSWRMDIINPFPSASANTSNYWKVNRSAPGFDWKQYDVIIYRKQDELNWSGWSRALTQVTAEISDIYEGYTGLVILDATGKNTSVADSLIESRKLNISISNAGASSAISNFYVCPWMLNIPSGYNLSNADLRSASTFKGTGANEAKCASINMNNMDPAEVDRKIFISSSDKQTVYLAESSVPRVILSTMGFSNMSTDAQKQMFCNIVWGFGAQEPVSKPKSYNVNSTFYTSWETTWVAGENENREPVLSESEMAEGNFRKVEDPSTGKIRYVRFLSNKTAKQLIMNIPEVVQFSRKQPITASNCEITLEISGDNGYTDVNTGGNKRQKLLKFNDKPEAWSTRIDSPVFNPDPGYLIDSFSRSSSSGALQKPPSAFPAVAQVIGTRISVKSFEFNWSTKQEFSYSTLTTTSKEIPLNTSSGYIDFVTTWSDIEWTAPNVLRDKNPLSYANMKDPGWGTQTAKKFYPWDGRIMLLRNGSSGANVRYIQQALNSLKAAGAGHTSATLKVDGSYGPATVAAVRNYQTRWSLTIDGVVDAGTAGHIMRNANSRTSWNVLDDTWKNFGNTMNMVDGVSATKHGRRSWINSTLSRISDQILIHLKSPVKVTKVRVNPHLPFSGNASFVNIWRAGGRISNNKSKIQWGFDQSSRLNSSLKAYHNTNNDINLSMTTTSDVLYLNLFQDHNAQNSSKVWALRHCIFYGLVSTTVRKYHSSTSSSPSNAFVKIRGGDVATYSVKASVPSGARFEGWKKSAAQMVIDIKATIPADIRDSIKVNVGINGATISITFSTILDDDPNEVTLGPQVPVLVDPHNRYSLDDDIDRGITTSRSVDGVLNDNKRSWVPGSLKGSLVRIMSGRYANRTSRIVSNTANSFTLKDSVFLKTIDRGTRYQINYLSCPHFPNTSEKDNPDDAFEIFYRVRVLSGSSRLTGVFAIMNDNKKDIDHIFSNMTLSQIDRYGLSKIRIALINNNLIGQDSIGGVDQYPVRYAMKPFCVIESRGRNVISVDGLTGKSPNEIWGLRVEATTVNRSIVIPKGFTKALAGNDNFMKDEYKLLLSAENSEQNEIEAIYSITSMEYSPKYGEPYIDMAGELSVWEDHETIRIANTPMLMEEDGFFPVELTHDPNQGTEADLSPKEIDIQNGTMKFDILDGSVEVGDKIYVDYTFREKNAAYFGSPGLKEQIAQQTNKSADTVSLSVQGDFFAFQVDIPEKNGEIDSIVFEGLVTVGTHTVRVALSHSPTPGTEYSFEDIELGASLNETDFTIPLEIPAEAGRNWLIIYKENDSIGSVGINSSQELEIYKPDTEKHIRENEVTRIVENECLDILVIFESRSDILDLCPYQGHKLQVDGQEYKTYELIGSTIYVFALPTTIRYGSYETGYTFIHSKRSLYHTLNGDMFNEESPSFNPFAILIAEVGIEDATDEMSSPTIIDTRRGGGGLQDKEVNQIRKSGALLHQSGFNEIDSLYDIGHLDGQAYIKGGSVIIEIPNSWIQKWIELGKTNEEIGEMIEDFKSKWIPPSKSVYIIYKDEEE